ncbi:MAG: response regulator transcription factor [Chloroflexi bacterium]|nr:response regulator transcription factor [Chloroflexota bacterium]
MEQQTVLVIDDEPALLRLLESVFSEAGYQIYTSTNGPEGLRQFYTCQPDLVILDLMMPEMDGWEICSQIRRLSDVPVIMLTAMIHDDEIIRGLTCGADEYVTKPFNSAVLLARAQALLRRAALPPTTKKLAAYSDGYLTIDLEAHRVHVCGQPVKLSVTEYGLLAYLLQNADRMLTFRQILGHIWGEACQDNIEYVHVYISHLRQKLEKDPSCPVYLLAERGVGYCFEKQAY